jgi:hypothetical protein
VPAARLVGLPAEQAEAHAGRLAARVQQRDGGALAEAARLDEHDPHRVRPGRHRVRAVAQVEPFDLPARVLAPAEEAGGEHARRVEDHAVRAVLTGRREELRQLAHRRVAAESRVAASAHEQASRVPRRRGLGRDQRLREIELERVGPEHGHS